jgi:hypothetical protein
MKDYTVRIRFTQPSLGNAKEKTTGRFLFMRSSLGCIIFLPAWHKSNMLMAATLLSIRPELVRGISWDIEIDAKLTEKRWQRVYYRNSTGRERYSMHEAIMPGQTIGINCVLPLDLDDNVFSDLMSTAGRYKGLSPWKPGDYGHYEVVDLFPRKFVCNQT